MSPKARCLLGLTIKKIKTVLKPSAVFFIPKIGGMNGNRDKKGEELKAVEYNPCKDLRPGDAEYERLK